MDMTKETVKVRDLMTKKVIHLERNDTLDKADEAMELGGIRHIPVLDAGRLVGMVSQRDLFRSALSFALGYGEKGSRTLLKTLHVKDVMQEPVVTANPEATVGEAAQLMLSNKIGCLPVVDNGTMVGLLTETDILRHVSKKSPAVHAPRG
jgi:CBS domain-containing membrane protein